MRADLHNLRYDTIQKIAVVCNDDHGSAVAGEISLQPADRLHIKVVGRLIEDDQIRGG